MIPIWLNFLQRWFMSEDLKNEQLASLKKFPGWAQIQSLRSQVN